MADITVKFNITDEQLRELLSCAFDGGIGYWCSVEGRKCPKGTSFTDFQGGGKLSTPGGSYWHWCQTIPMAGGSLALLDTESGARHTLTRAKLRKGLQTMAAKAPRHFADFVAENADATTGDVYLQCCLFGDIVYG